MIPTHVINMNVADVRIKGKFKSERKTQALYSEPVELLKTGTKYAKVRLYDDYEGHVSKLFISELKPQTGDEYVISSVLTPAYTRPEKQSPFVTQLPFAAEIRGEKVSDDYVQSKSTRYGDIFLKLSDLTLADKAPRLSKENIPHLLDIAKRFIGVPYLWGGRSYFGVDCSGFVHVLMKYFGAQISRKTKDQKNFGMKITKGAIEPGDLLFFRIHVGIAINSHDYIHSSLTQGGVHINTLDNTKKGYLRYRDETLRAIRRHVYS
jgi:gamma-D-glutamyl-L-lysine dipeptidyl-peptidase